MHFLSFIKTRGKRLFYGSKQWKQIHHAHTNLKFTCIDRLKLLTD